METIALLDGKFLFRLENERHYLLSKEDEVNNIIKGRKALLLLIQDDVDECICNYLTPIDAYEALKSDDIEVLGGDSEESIIILGNQNLDSFKDEDFDEIEFEEEYFPLEIIGYNGISYSKNENNALIVSSYYHGSGVDCASSSSILVIYEGFDMSRIKLIQVPYLDNLIQEFSEEVGVDHYSELTEDQIKRFISTLI